MKKVVLWVLVGLGAIFAIGLLQAMWQGFSSTANPGGAIERARQETLKNQQR